MARTIKGAGRMSSGASGAASAISKNVSASTVKHPRPSTKQHTAGRTTPRQSLKPGERNIEVGPLVSIGNANVA